MPRSTAIGWIAAVLVALGGVAAVVWASQERTAIEEQVASARGDLEDRRDELEGLRKTVETREAEVENVAQALAACVDAVREHIRGVGRFGKELANATFGALPGLQQQVEDMIDRADAELECELTSTDSV